MLKNKILLFFGTILILATSCKDENLAPIITFDQTEKGAYVRVIKQTNPLVNLLDVNGSIYTFDVEFVDIEQGSLVSEYRLQLTYEDNDDSNGDDSAGPIEFRSWSASEFETTATGFKGLSNIIITGPEVLAALGLEEDQVIAGDNFKFTGAVTTTEGATFTAANSSSTVNGGAFRGFLDFNMPAGCPSSLEGDYMYVLLEGKAICPGGETNDTELTGTISINSLGGGEYWISDWALGSWAPCYGEGSVADKQDGLTFLDICKEIKFNKNEDTFEEIWTWDSSIEGTDWTISYTNTYGEGGTSVIINPAGWDLSIKE